MCSRQSAHIVVRLDHMRLAGLGARRFDDIRIDRALRQPFDILELRRLFVEYFDEHPADDLALLFRIGFAGQRRQEALLGVDANDVHAHVFGERRHHLIALAQAQQSMIDEYAGQLRTDGLVQQRGEYRRVDAARQPQQHAVARHLRANARHAVVDDVARWPSSRRSRRSRARSASKSRLPAGYG